MFHLAVDLTEVAPYADIFNCINSFHIALQNDHFLISDRTFKSAAVPTHC